MSTKQSVVSAKEAIKVFVKIGFEVVRQKGSHIRMRDYSNQKHLPLTIPNHKIIKPGLLRNLMNDAGISLEEFRELLK